MDSNGVNISDNSFADGGTITGNLDIEANLKVTGDTELKDFTADNGIISGTLEVGTIVSDIIVEDPIIHLAKDNPADLLNTGYVEEFNDGVIKFSGILRSKDDKKHYLLENVTPQPTGGTNITALNRGDMVLNDLTSNLHITQNVASTNAVNAQTHGIANAGLVNRHTLAHDTPTDSLAIKNAGGTDLILINQSGETILKRTDREIKINEPLSVINAYVADNVLPNFMVYNRARDTLASPNQLLTADQIVVHQANGYDGTAYVGLTQIKHVTTETITPTAQGSGVEIATKNIGTTSLSNKLIINDYVNIPVKLKLSVVSTRDNNSIGGAFWYRVRSDNSLGGNGSVFYKSRGTVGSETAVISGDRFYEMSAQGHDGTSFGGGTLILHEASEDWTLTEHGAKIVIQTTDTGSTTSTTKMIIGDTVDLSTNINMFLNDISDVNFLTAITTITDNLTVGIPATNYTLPTVRGTAGYVLTTDGVGGTSWQPEVASSETLQQAYDASIAPQIVTSVGDPALTLKSHTASVTGVFSIEDVGGLTKFRVDNNGFVAVYDGLEIGTATPATAYTLPNVKGSDGDVLTLSGNSLQFIKPLSYFNYSQTVTVAVPTNDTVEHSVFDSTGALGIDNIPANTIELGTAYHMKLGGVLRNQNSSADLRIRVTLGGVLVMDTFVINMDAVATLSWFELECDLTFRGVGVSAGSIYSTQFTYVDSGIYKGSGFSASGLNIDTTVNNTWGVSVQWSTASVDNVMIVRELYINKII